MVIKNIFLFAFAVVLMGSCNVDKPVVKNDNDNIGSTGIEYWITTPDKTRLLDEDDKAVKMIDAPGDLPIIEIDTAKKYQSIDGFGFALTGGSAMLLNQKLSHSTRSVILNEIFGKSENAIGVSYLRVSIGASDLDEKVFSYCDLPNGAADPDLKKFSMHEDEKNLIPVLKEILTINPAVKIMASPWSAPAWMKDNGSPKGGSLLPKYYGTYAHYFVRYIEGMKDHGIDIDAITIQNEPENPKNNPSMVMTPEQQSAFIRDHLGPAFQKAGIKTKIVAFDHNCDHPEYPITVLNDAETKKYVDGSAFHLYLGEINALTKVNDAHPDRNVYFTEQWTSPEGTFGGDLLWHTVNLTIGATRNWSRNVLEWNLAADPGFNPHTDAGGCTMCLGALTIDNENVTRNVSYYIIGHASKFISPGSLRIATTLVNGIANVGFIRPDGRVVLLLANEKDNTQEFVVQNKNKLASVSLPAGAVATVVW